ncbi:hypothetical protein LG634_05780 [Streptomyces bambusae]|uniref:hypothetical protein n=1 Tax=Streptomyces bambusae TaxID=1550616 RepID=UPI001CFE9E44|nr:hypothetical protein [Streptomyces bambusae]MCB5164346.1 hypothetical protein [Streptomyces bambusae]
MNNSPTFHGVSIPRPLQHLTGSKPRILSVSQLRQHGITPSDTSERCRPGGPWQQVLPGVFLLHPGVPTSEERLHGALLYAGRRGGEAMITGAAALALYGFSAAPPLLALDRIDVLVPGTRRLRSVGWVHLVRAPVVPQPVQVTGVPVAPVARALADAVADLDDAGTVRRLLSEAVRGGHCDPAAVVRELTAARLLSRPHVVDAVDSLLAEGRAIAEDRLYELVRVFGLPEPLWNVDLRLPGGPQLGGVDAYWPDQAVAVELDTRAPRQGGDDQWTEYARKREHLERLGLTVVYITPRKLRDHAEQQAAVIRTALTASGDRDPAAYVVVLPR